MGVRLCGTWVWLTDSQPGIAAGGTEQRVAAEGRGLEALAGWARSAVLPSGTGVLVSLPKPLGEQHPLDREVNVVALSHPRISQPLSLVLHAAVGFKLERALGLLVLAPSVSPPLTLHLDTLCKTVQASWGEPEKGSENGRDQSISKVPAEGGGWLLSETQLDDPQWKLHSVLQRMMKILHGFYQFC